MPRRCINGCLNIGKRNNNLIIFNRTYITLKSSIRVCRSIEWSSAQHITFYYTHEPRVPNTHVFILTRGRTKDNIYEQYRRFILYMYIYIYIYINLYKCKYIHIVYTFYTFTISLRVILAWASDIHPILSSSHQNYTM